MLRIYIAIMEQLEHATDHERRLLRESAPIFRTIADAIVTRDFTRLDSSERQMLVSVLTHLFLVGTETNVEIVLKIMLVTFYSFTLSENLKGSFWKVTEICWKYDPKLSGSPINKYFAKS